MPIITILHGNPDNDQLTLSDGGHTRARQGASVFWEIANNSGVSEIRIERKSRTNNIWLHEPGPQGMDGGWKGVVNPHARIGAEYNYSIIWRSTGGGSPRTHDPKISVMPVLSHRDMTIPIALAAMGLMALSIFLILRSRRRKEREDQFSR